MDGEMSGSRGRWAEYGRSDGPRVRRGRRGRGTACLASFSQAGGTAAGDGGIVHVSEADGSGRTGEQGKLQTGRRLMASETRRRCAEREPVAVHGLLVGGESTSGQDEREQSAAESRWPTAFSPRLALASRVDRPLFRLRPSELLLWASPGLCAARGPTVCPLRALAPTPPSNPFQPALVISACASRGQAEATSGGQLPSPPPLRLPCPSPASVRPPACPHPARTSQPLILSTRLAQSHSLLPALHDRLILSASRVCILSK